MALAYVLADAAGRRWCATVGKRGALIRFVAEQNRLCHDGDDEPPPPGRPELAADPWEWPGVTPIAGRPGG